MKNTVVRLTASKIAERLTSCQGEARSAKRTPFSTKIWQICLSAAAALIFFFTFTSAAYGRTYFDFRSHAGTVITTQGDGSICLPLRGNCKYIVINLGQPIAAIVGVKYYQLNLANFNIIGAGCTSGALDIAVYNDAAYTSFDHAFHLDGSGTSPQPISSNINFSVPADKFAQLIFGCNDGGVPPVATIDGGPGAYQLRDVNSITYTGLPNLCIGDTPADCGAQENPVLQLTNDPAFDGHPAWSPDGNTIAFISNRGKHTTLGDVWAINPDGMNLRQLTAVPDFNEFGLASIAWIGNTGDIAVLDTEIFWEYFRIQLSAAPSLPIVRTVADGDSPYFQRLLFIPGGLGSNSFAVSPDGSTAAWTILTTPFFSCPWQSDFRISPLSALNGDSGTLVGSSLLSASSNCPSNAGESFRGIAFSPDGSEIVVSRNVDPNLPGFDLEIYKTDGTFVRRLTFDGTNPSAPIINYNPSWSSDNRIAFAANVTGRFEIYTLSTDGLSSRPTQITFNGGDWPSWSPYSSGITFQSSRNGNSEIYVLPIKKAVPPLPPVLSISSNQIQFGNVPVGESLELTLRVTNTGGSILTGSAITNSPFTIISSATINLASGESQIFIINFGPITAGQYLKTLSLVTDGGEADVTLQGTGVQTNSFVTGQITRVVSSAFVPLPDVPVVRLDKDLNFQEMSFTDMNGKYFLTEFADKDFVVPVSSGAGADADDPNLGVHGYIFSLPSLLNISTFCQIGMPTASRKCEGTKGSPLGNFVAFPKPISQSPSITLTMPLPSGSWRVSVEAGGFAVTDHDHPIDADPSHTDASSGFYALDFPGPCGTPILAVADGYVRVAGAGGSFGRTVVIEHSGELFSRYAHLDSIPLKEIHTGVNVTQGEVIGYMGNGGVHVGGAHLHFQIYDGDFQPSDSQSADTLLRTIRLETGTGNLAFTDFIAGRSYLSTNGTADSTSCSH